MGGMLARAMATKGTTRTNALAWTTRASWSAWPRRQSAMQQRVASSSQGLSSSSVFRDHGSRTPRSSGRRLCARAAGGREREEDFVSLRLPLPRYGKSGRDENGTQTTLSGDYAHGYAREESDGFASAMAVVGRLHRRGHAALFAGGWVRDRILLLGGAGTSRDGDTQQEQISLSFLDIDVATSASDQEVLSCFPHTSHFTDNRIRTVVVVDDQLRTNTEVTCFRGDDPLSPREDALLRDFTCNALFYDVETEEVRDYLGGQGLRDCDGRILRAVNRAEDRFREDPCRLMRAVRLAATLDLTIEGATLAAIRSPGCQAWLEDVSRERLFMEVVKSSKTSGAWARALGLLAKTGLAAHVFPKIAEEDFARAAEVARRVALVPPSASLAFEDSEAVTGVRLGALLPLERSDHRDYKDLCQRSGCPKKYKKDILCPSLLHDLEASRRGEDREDETGRTNLALDFYASDLNIVACSLAFYSHHLALTRSEAEGRDFLERHRREMRRMGVAIEMRRRNERVVTSAVLRREGVAPGPRMGRLLDLAQALAAEEGIFEERALVARLKASPLWLQHHQSGDKVAK